MADMKAQLSVEEMALPKAKILKIRIGFCLPLIQTRRDGRHFTRVAPLFGWAKRTILLFGADLMG
jgi:hypothetical protein